MSQIPYTPLAGKIKEYFDKIQETKVPPKVDNSWLKSIGFAGGNDSYILRVLRHIGFVDDSKVSTDLWKEYKDPTKSRAVLAQAIREGYKDLFDTYEDAHRKDNEALYAFFSSKTGMAKRTVDLMVSTFTNLCQLADFEKEIRKIEKRPTKIEIPQKSVTGARPEKGLVSEMHINIQLHLPATNDPTVYDTLFKSLRKHLLSDEE
jgi:hypothetical protein